MRSTPKGACATTSKMPKPKTDKKLTPEEQAKRFKEAAEKAGVAQDEKAFEDAFKKVTSQKPKQRSAP